MFQIKSQSHDADGTCHEKIFETDYQWVHKEEAQDERMVMAADQCDIKKGDSVVHLSGLSVVNHADGSYTTYWVSGDE